MVLNRPDDKPADTGVYATASVERFLTFVGSVIGDFLPGFPPDSSTTAANGRNLPRATGNSRKPGN
jgi:hypothetical protein